MTDTKDMIDYRIAAIVAGPREVASTEAARLRNIVRTLHARIAQRGRATRDQERDLTGALLMLDYELSPRGRRLVTV